MTTTRPSARLTQKRSVTLRPVGSTFVSTLALAACGSGDDGAGAPGGVAQSGLAIKGPLDDFRVFIDSNGNGIYDAGEAFAISGVDGAYSLHGAAGQTLLGEVTSTTIDAASGRVIAGYFAAAPAGSSVMSPMTTVLAQTALSESDLRAALGLSVDLLSYNPFDAANISTAAARDAEHVAQQLANITRALTGLGEGAGLGARPAFDIASNALNTVLIDHVTNNPNGAIDLWGDATIGAIMTAYRAGLEAAGHSTTVFDALRAEIDGAVDIVNQRILAVGNLTSTEARAVFGLPSDLYAQINAAATAIANGQANPGLSLDTWAGLERQLAENGFTPPAPPAPPAPAGAAPVLTVNNPTDTFTVQSDIDATLEVTGGGVLANLVAGNAFTLVQQGAVTTGTLFARANGQTSAASAQTFTLGTAGNDAIDTSGAGNRVDFIFGGDGGDNIDAGAGNDHIAGGNGNDTLTGGAGVDRIYAGAGDDIIIADEADAAIMGGLGQDTLRIASNFNPGQGVVFDVEIAEIIANDRTVWFDRVNAGGAGLTIDATNGLRSTIRGTGNDDTITGSAADDTLDGWAGNDEIDGDGGDDRLQGGTGNDVFIISAGNDTIVDLATGDSFSVAAGARVTATSLGFVATAATQNLGGQTDRATIDVAINGGSMDLSAATVVSAATDGFRVRISHQFAANTTHVGSDGNDIIANTGNAVNLTMTGGAGADTLTGGANTDTVSYADVTLATSHGLANIAGMAVNLSGANVTAATIATAMGGGVVIGGGNGAAGADLAAGTAGYLATSAGNSTTTMVRDTLTGFEAVTGSALADYIVLGNGGMSANGANGNDVIIGGTGNDTITGGAGEDNLNGGDGDDVFIINSVGDHFGTESIVGGNGIDEVRITDTGHGAIFTANPSLSVERIVIANQVGDTSGTSVINVDAEPMHVSENVTIIGNNGHNVIIGNAGNNEINGGGGADILIGNEGADILTGGAGADIFVIETVNAGGIDTITDLTGGLGADVVRFNSGGAGPLTGFIDATGIDYDTGNATLADALADVAFVGLASDGDTIVMMFDYAGIQHYLIDIDAAGGGRTGYDPGTDAVFISDANDLFLGVNFDIL